MIEKIITKNVAELKNSGVLKRAVNVCEEIIEAGEHSAPLQTKYTKVLPNGNLLTRKVAYNNLAPEHSLITHTQITSPVGEVKSEVIGIRKKAKTDMFYKSTPENEYAAVPSAEGFKTQVDKSYGAEYGRFQNVKDYIFNSYIGQYIANSLGFANISKTLSNFGSRFV